MGLSDGSWSHEGDWGLLKKFLETERKREKYPVLMFAYGLNVVPPPQRSCVEI
jgi:hypothetical protein